MGPRPKTAHEHHQSRQGLGRRPSWRGWEAVVPECQAGWESAIPPAPPTGISGPPAPIPPRGTSHSAPGLQPGSHRLVRLHADLKGLLLQRFERDGDGHGGAERWGNPRIFTQHATHAAAILAPSRAARRQLPGQALRAPTIRMRDLRTSLPPTTRLS